MHAMRARRTFAALILFIAPLMTSPVRAQDKPAEDRAFLLQAYTMLAMRVIEPEQQVMATNDQCRERGLGGSSLPAAFSEWTKRNRVLYAKAHVVFSQPFMDRVVGASVASSDSMKAQRQTRSSIVLHNYQEARAWLNAMSFAALTTRCGEFEKQLRSGALDYRRQQPGAFRIIEKVDLNKPLSYTPDQLLALGK